MPENGLTYEKISAIERGEKKSQDLIKIPQTFYTDLAEYIANIKTDWESENKKDLSSAKAMTLRDNYRRIEKKQKHIYEYRERKIFFKALNQLNDGKANIKNMTPEEEGMFRKLVSFLEEERRKILVRPLVNEGTDVNQSGHMVEEEDRQKKSEPEVPKSVNGKTKPVVLEIVKEVPTFAGVDCTYTFKVGDVVCLPENIASILYRNDLAKKIDVKI